MEGKARARGVEVITEFEAGIYASPKRRPAAPTGGEDLENEQLAPLAAEGNEWAREQIIDRNRGFIASIARRYIRRCRHLTLEDLMAAGAMGVLTAAGKFDPTRGMKFTSYAGWWIRHEVMRAVQNEEATIRIPVHLLDDTQRHYNGKEVAGGAAKLARIEKAGMVRFVTSLDAPIGNDDSLALGDTIADKGERVDEELERVERDERVRAALSRLVLSPRERAIVERGMMGGENLREIADTFGLSRERMRQIDVGLRKKLARVLAGI